MKEAINLWIDPLCNLSFIHALNAQWEPSLVSRHIQTTISPAHKPAMAFFF